MIGQRVKELFYYSSIYQSQDGTQHSTAMNIVPESALNLYAGDFQEVESHAAGNK